MLIFLIAIAVLYVLAYAYSRRLWDIQDTPAVSPSGAIIGLCEVNGRVSRDVYPSGEKVPFLRSPITDIECIWFDVLVEYYSPSKDEPDWHTLYKRSSNGGFRIEDQYGSIGVNPNNCELQITKTLNHDSREDVKTRAKYYYDNFIVSKGSRLEDYWQSTPDGYYWWHPNVGRWIPYTYVSTDRSNYYDFEKSQWRSIQGNDFVQKFINRIVDKGNQSLWRHKIRVSETVLKEGTDVFAHGKMDISSDGTDIILGKVRAKGSMLSMLSDKPETEVIHNVRNKAITFSVLGVLVLTISYVIMIQQFIQSSENLTPTVALKSYSIAAFLYICGGLLTYVIVRLLRTYNRFIRLKQQVNLSRSALDIAQRRRADLIPQLIEVVDVAKQYEQATQQLFARLRESNNLNASEEITALMEQYPDLKVADNFLYLQKELGRTEEKVAMARSFINDSILAIDQLRATFSGMIISPFFSKDSYTKV